MHSMNSHAIYDQLAEAVRIETKRLYPLNKTKASEIDAAMIRLRYLINFIENPHAKRGVKIEVKLLDESSLKNLHSMMNVKVSFCDSAGGINEKKSVREALNISRYNLFNIIDPHNKLLVGTMWGKSTALKHVEERLKFHS